MLPRTLTIAALLSTVDAFAPPACPNATPGPTDPKECPLKAPADPAFADICHPGATGHAGGAEAPNGRCSPVNYTDGVFRCACCGAPLWYAVSKYSSDGYEPDGGWPAFRGNGSVKQKDNYTTADGDHVCAPIGGSEVVCSNCGSHLGDFFPAGSNGNSEDYYCIDGVCLLPPGAVDGDVCKEDVPPPPSRAEALNALRALARKKGAAILDRLRHEH